MLTLFTHGPGAGPVVAHGEFESVEAVEKFLAENSPFEEGCPLYIVSEDNTRIWALTEESIESGIEKFYDATGEDWAAGQIELLRSEERRNANRS